MGEWMFFLKFLKWERAKIKCQCETLGKLASTWEGSSINLVGDGKLVLCAESTSKKFGLP